MLQTDILNEVDVSRLIGNLACSISDRPDHVTVIESNTDRNTADEDITGFTAQKEYFQYLLDCLSGRLTTSKNMLLAVRK